MNQSINDTASITWTSFWWGSHVNAKQRMKHCINVLPKQFPSMAKKIRYDTYLAFGFTYTTVGNEKRPQCVVCLKVLACDSLKPNKLTVRSDQKRQNRLWSLTSRRLQSPGRQRLKRPKRPKGRVFQTAGIYQSLIIHLYIGFLFHHGSHSGQPSLHCICIFAMETQGLLSIWVHNVLKNHPLHGEFHRLIQELRFDDVWLATITTWSIGGRLSPAPAPLQQGLQPSSKHHYFFGCLCRQTGLHHKALGNWRLQ